MPNLRLEESAYQEWTYKTVVESGDQLCQRFAAGAVAGCQSNGISLKAAHLNVGEKGRDELKADGAPAWRLSFR